jgi:hypothetical protein
MQERPNGWRIEQYETQTHPPGRNLDRPACAAGHRSFYPSGPTISQGPAGCGAASGSSKEGCCGYNDLDGTELLLQHGANANYCEPLGSDSLFMWAVYAGHLDMIRLLLRHGAKVNAYRQEGKTALDIAREMPSELCAANHADMIHLLEAAARKEQAAAR